jgi:hypothetical protein
VDELWDTARLEPCLNWWIADDEPTHEQRMATGQWIMGLMEDPLPASVAPVIDSPIDLWIGIVPGTTVAVMYGVDEDERLITFHRIVTLNSDLTL